MKRDKTTAHISRKHSWIAPTLLLILACVTAPICQAQHAPKKVIIDTDPGTDDALALLLAFNSPEVEVQAITIVAGM